MLALNITQAKELQEIERYKSQGYNAKAEPTGQLAAIMKESGSKPSYTLAETAAYRIRTKLQADAWGEKRQR